MSTSPQLDNQLDLDCNRMDDKVSVRDAVLDTDVKPDITEDGTIVVRPYMCQGNTTGYIVMYVIYRVHVS